MSLDQSFSFQINVFHMMSRTERKIAVAYADMYSSSKFNKWHKLFFSQDYLCKKSGCNRRSLYRFNQKYSYLVQTKLGKFNTLKKKRETNTTFIDPYFFEVIAWLKYKKLIGIVSVRKSSFIRQVNENEHLMMSKFGFYFGVMNNKMSHKECVKCPNISSISKIQYTVPPTQVPGVTHPNLKELPLATEKLKYIQRFYSPYAVAEACKDRSFYLSTGHQIRNEKSFIFSRLKAYMIPKQKRYGSGVKQIR